MPSIHPSCRLWWIAAATCWVARIREKGSPTGAKSRRAGAAKRSHENLVPGGFRLEPTTRNWCLLSPMSLLGSRTQQSYANPCKLQACVTVAKKAAGCLDCFQVTAFPHSTMISAKKLVSNLKSHDMLLTRSLRNDFVECLSGLHDHILSFCS